MPDKVIFSFREEGDGKLRLLESYGPIPEKSVDDFASKTFIGHGEIDLLVFDVRIITRVLVEGELPDNEKTPADPDNHFEGEDGKMHCRCHGEPSGIVEVFHEVEGGHKDAFHIEKTPYCRFSEVRPEKEGKPISDLEFCLSLKK